VTTSAHASRWYPAPVAARVRSLDSLWGWLEPFRILEELNFDRRLDGWGYIDRCVAALNDVRRAAPAPDPKAFRAWEQRRRKEDEIKDQQVRARRERERPARKYQTAA
jgi:hypothetical protein